MRSCVRATDKVVHTLRWRAGLWPALGVPMLGANQNRNPIPMGES
jgi:hypothetical protein